MEVELIDLEAIQIVRGPVAYVPAPVPRQVYLCHLAHVLCVAPFTYFPTNFSFTTTVPVTAKAHARKFLVVIRFGFQVRFTTRYNSRAPLIKWKQCSRLKFILRSKNKLWRMMNDVETMLPKPERKASIVDTSIVEVGKLEMQIDGRSENS